MKDKNFSEIRGLTYRYIKDRACLCFRCEQCKDVISKASEALIIEYEGDSAASVVHKVCNQVLQANRVGSQLSEELDTALAYLLENSGVDNMELKNARLRARSLLEV
ncbi:MAG: hypothetical protein FJ320_07795 [SAR202 cluster bacterium]|nr:hypothetical protein [SAR202 cluster bacterium]